ncbi:MAG: class I adenylate-forming enzyme family protein [Bacteroidota bacterium]
MLVHHDLIDAARRHPDKIAVIAADRATSFRVLDEDSDRLAAALQRLGIRRGDRVAVMLDNGVEMVVALWASLKAGAAFVPIPAGTKQDKLAFILADCEARCLVAPETSRHPVVAACESSLSRPAILWVGDAAAGGENTLAGILAQPHQRPADPKLIDQDLCLLIYTSGSTGRAKGVMMTHAAVRNNVWAIGRYLGNTPDDVVLCILPLAFNYGLFQVLVGAHIGYTTVLEKSFAYPFQSLKLVAAHRVTGLAGVPTMFASLLQLSPFTGLDLSSLRYMTNAAAPLAPAHALKLRQVLPHVAFFSMYGLTECTRVSFLDPAKIATKPGSVGQAIPNSEIFLVDEDDNPVAPGEVGELVVRSAGIMRGYWRRPNDTARALRDGGLAGEKLLYTGDLFRADADGDLSFVGRRDDVFKCRGEKVSPREIESVLYELVDVAEAAVVGVPDPIDGMTVKAFVVVTADSGLTEAQLRRHCRARLEPHLVPRHIELRTSLPKTESGKIAKAALRLPLDEKE